MNRAKRLVTDLWWLLLTVLAITVGMAWYVSPFFWVYLPMAAGFFTYFAFVRYDAVGNDRQQ